MPKGKHKGKVKHYLTSEEVEEQEQKRQRELEWKRKKGLPDEEEESKEDSDGEDVKKKGSSQPTHPRDMPPDSEDEDDDGGDADDSSEGEEKTPKKKGVESLIEIENPNRLPPKVQKAKNVDVNAKVELSRREREDIEQQRKQAAYNKLHEQGLTEEARRDLARLAIIRQQREEGAKRKVELPKAEADTKSKP